MKQVQLVPTMGTVVSLDVRTPAEPEAFEQAVTEVAGRLRGIDEMFSPWRADSWVSRLIAGALAPTDCPAEVQQVVEAAGELEDLTDGYFSPFWRRDAHGDPGPDPTGLVKGWAAQQASDLLVARGLPDHVVNAAGDVVVSGRPTPGGPAGPWRVGISDPRRTAALVGVVVLDRTAARWAVATSGLAELGAHVSDPHTGAFPASVVSATVVTRLDAMRQGGATADACATALVAAGDRAPALLSTWARHGIEGFLVEADGSVQDPRQLLVPA